MTHLTHESRHGPGLNVRTGRNGPAVRVGSRSSIGCDGVGFEDGTRGLAAIFAIYVPSSKHSCHLRSAVAIFERLDFRSRFAHWSVVSRPWSVVFG
jgi:hypothetical protein